MPAQDINAWDFNPVQTEQQLGPVTIASAATIAPKSFVTIVTGSAAIANITPPLPGVHMLALIAAVGAAFTMTAAGNIAVAVNAAVAETVTLLVYDPVGKLYYPMKSGAIA